MKNSKKEEGFYKQLAFVIENADTKDVILTFINSKQTNKGFNLYFNYWKFNNNVAIKNNSIKKQDFFLKQFIESNYDKLKYSAQKEVLNVFAFNKWKLKDFSTVLEIIKEYKKSFKERNDLNYAICLNISALVNLSLGKQEEAIELLNKAIEILNIKENDEGFNKILTHVNNSLALIYRNQQKFKDALSLMKKNLAIQLKYNEKLGLSHSYMNIGNIYYHEKKYLKAIEYDLKAQKIFREIGDNPSADILDLNIACFYYEYGDLKLAEKYANICFNSSNILTKKLNTELLLRLALKKFEKSNKTKQDKLLLLNKAVTCLKNIDDLKDNSYKITYYGTIAEAFALSGEIKKALNLHNIKFDLNNEQNNLEKLDAYKQLRESHEILLQQKEIEKKELLLEQKERLNVKLKRVNDELEQFTSMASHDLKSPLRTILAICGLIKDDNLSKEELVEYLALIEKDTLKMNSLVDSLLKYSKIGYQNVEMEHVSVYKLLKELVESLSAEINQKNAIISIGELPEIKGNKILLQQLFQNLITNALKYNEKDQPEINIYLSENNNTIEIVDNGIGIPENKIEDIFKAFIRAHSSAQYEGSGVGLATCKKIMDIHSGSISVSSEVGKGSCFSLKFKTDL